MYSKTITELNRIKRGLAAIRIRDKKKNQEEEEIVEIECTESIFSPKNIVGSFKAELINESRLVPFLTKIKPNSQRDQTILQNWIDHFQGILGGKKLKFQIPYVITKEEETGYKTIWIEQRL